MKTTFRQLSVDASAAADQLYDTISKVPLTEFMTPADLTTPAD